MFGRKSKTSFVPGRGLSAKRTVAARTGATAAQTKISLIKQNGVSFEKKVASAVNMQKAAGVDTMWDVIGLLDESGSMSGLFRNGTVQEITERALAWTAGVDSDGMAPFGAFGSHHIWHSEVDLSNVAGIVQREGWHAWGSTNLTASLNAVLDVAKNADNPVYVFIVTDGAPDNERTALDAIKAMSEYPIFVKILLVGNDSRGKRFVDMLDDLEQHQPGGRLFDNVDAQHISNPSGVSDDQFNRMMTEEVADALAAMRQVGLVR